MFRQFFTIADVNIRVLSDRKLELTSESAPFLCEEPDRIDLTVTVQETAALPEPPDQGVWESGRCFLGGTVYHCNGSGKPSYARVTEQPNRDIRIDYLPHSAEALLRTSGLINALGLERLLLGFDALILHASFVRWNGGGVLFTAPPGTGKSTQASLWEAYAGAEILNGDRACLRRREGQWLAYGMPYAGSSDIFRNAWAPVRGIVVLRQTPENRVRRMQKREALLCLFPELSMRRWDAEFVNHAMDLTGALLGSIPVYLLECRPDQNAVEVLQAALTEEE